MLIVMFVVLSANDAIDVDCNLDSVDCNVCFVIRC